MADQTYTLVAVGTGFATSFFLQRVLKLFGANASILVLERGPHVSHADQIAARPARPLDGAASIALGGAVAKPWKFSIGMGGGSNCWWGCTPRMLPADFEMQSRYGVGDDWPIGYEALAPYYAQAEAIMAISGPARPPYPMAQPLPQAPHILSDPDRALQTAYGDLYVPQSTARARKGTSNRPPCCASAMCSLCPIDAKFTVLNEMADIYADPRVTVLTEAQALRIETTAGLATGVVYRRGGVDHLAKGETVAVGANAIFNAFLLLKSGFQDPALGRYLHEQAGVEAFIDLKGMRGFQGSTVITGQGYMFYDGAHRRDRAAAMLEGWNRTRPRLVHGRWAEATRMKMIFEDLPLWENRVAVSPDDPDRPVAITERRSDYMLRSLSRAEEMYNQLFAHLPVEGYTLRETTDEGHIMGTARMGTDPATSVVDADLVHHGVRNLWVLGGSSFVTGAPANPTLTLSALSLRAADRMFDRAAGDGT